MGDCIGTTNKHKASRQHTQNPHSLCVPPPPLSRRSTCVASPSEGEGPIHRAFCVSVNQVRTSIDEANSVVLPLEHDTPKRIKLAHIAALERESCHRTRRVTLEKRETGWPAFEGKSTWEVDTACEIVIFLIPPHCERRALLSGFFSAFLSWATKGVQWPLNHSAVPLAMTCGDRIGVTSSIGHGDEATALVTRRTFQPCAAITTPCTIQGYRAKAWTWMSGYAARHFLKQLGLAGVLSVHEAQHGAIIGARARARRARRRLLSAGAKTGEARIPVPSWESTGV